MRLADRLIYLFAISGAILQGRGKLLTLRLIGRQVLVM